MSFGAITKYKIALGDGNNRLLLTARSAHTNACGYVPITLLLLFVFEYSGGALWLVYFNGTLFLLGRLLHPIALYKRIIKMRVIAMVLTFLPYLFLQ